MLSRIANLFRQRRLDREMDLEMSLHLEHLEQEFQAAGFSKEEARLAALKEFGGLAAARERYRNQRGIPFFETLARDTRYAFRSLLRTPWLTATILLTLMLAIGVNVVLFSALYPILLRPLPYNSPDRLVWITAPVIGMNDAALASDAVAWRTNSKTIETLAAVFSEDLSLDISGTHIPIRVTRTSESLGTLLGVPPVAGRDFNARDFTPESHEAALISDRISRNYAIQPGALLSLGGQTFEVVGILPTGFKLPLPSPFGPQAEPDAVLASPLIDLPGNSGTPTQVIGRLRPGIRIETAQAELQVIHAALPEGGERAAGEVHVIPLHQRITGSVRQPLLLLWLAVGFVLLVACVNVANLLLARSSSRTRELAVRTALGASRLTIVRALLTEGVILSALGGGAGVLFAFLISPRLIAWIPVDVPLLTAAPLNWTILLVSLTACLLTGVVCGILPALAAARVGPAESMKDRSRASSAAGKVRLQSILAASELALALVLVVGAGLVVKSLWLMRVNSESFAPEKVLVTNIESAEARSADKADTLEDLIRRIETIPGVQAAAVWNPGHQQSPTSFAVQTQAANKTLTEIVRATPHFLRASGITLLAGRWFGEQERASATAPAIVNLAFLRHNSMATEDPSRVIGQTIHLGPYQRSIAGVVSDFRPRPDVDPQPLIFLPATGTQNMFFGNESQLLIRTSDDPAVLAASLQQILKQFPGLNLSGTSTLADKMSGAIAPRRFHGMLLGALAALALALSLVGASGVLNYAVTERMLELGVRIALGASSREILKLVLIRGAKIAAVGIAIGLAGAAVLSRFMSGLLYGVKPTDPWTYLIVSLLLAAAALAASYLPARRASRIDPIETLRYE